MATNNVGTIAKNAAFQFLSGIVEAKESGQKLPKALDKIAGLAIKGKGTAVEIAKETAKDELRLKTPWIIATVLGIIVLVLFFKK